MSQRLKIKDLIPHKDNDFFFDDIKGDAWDEFVESIKTSGVIEPIVVTQEKVIISGHQRVMACKFLGIEEIEAEVRIVDTDDEILKQLIETNIRQRGIGNTNPVKFGRCLKELERIYGVRDGSAGGTGANQYTNEVESNNFTEADLANQLGLTRQTIQNYKQLADAIPEIQDLVETGIVTPTTARAIVKKLPEFQQKELAKQFAEKMEKVTQKEAEEEIARLNARITDLATSKSQREKFAEQKAERFKAETETLKARIKELEEADSEIVEKEVYPEDYGSNTEQLELLKQQMIVNAKIELADFVKKYMDYVDVKALIKRTLETL